MKTKSVHWVKGTHFYHDNCLLCVQKSGTIIHLLIFKWARERYYKLFHDSYNSEQFTKDSIMKFGKKWVRKSNIDEILANEILKDVL